MSCKHLKPNCMLYQPTLNWWGMLNISVAAFLLALLFFIISTSPSSAEFSFLQLICPAGWAGRSQATVVLLAQEQALQPSSGLCLVLLEDLEKLQKWLWGWNPTVTVREGSGGSEGPEEWICCLLPAEQQLVPGLPLGPALGSLLPKGPCPGSRAAGLLHLLSGYCFGRV